MLDTINILIGFAMVMLVLSLATTSIVQMVVVVCQLRGRNLRDGLVSLLRQLDPRLDRDIAHAIATAVVKHPLVARMPGQLGSVIQREELIELLLGFAAGSEPTTVEGGTKERLTASIKQLGIADPAGVLRDIRTTSMRLELTRPELSASARRTTAIVSEAASEFVAGINAWFDGTIDRVGESFTANVRVVTAIVVIVLASFVQIDAFELINRLAIDKELRATLVEQAETIAAAAPRAPTPADSTANPTGRELATNVGRLRSLATSNLITLPWDPAVAERAASDVHEGGGVPRHLAGIVLSAILLGLGAPFWFNSLKYLLSLRSAFSAKEEGERVERSGTSPGRAPDAPPNAGPDGAGHPAPAG